jgi:hypothetical protein
MQVFQLFSHRSPFAGNIRWARTVAGINAITNTAGKAVPNKLFRQLSRWK